MKYKLETIPVWDAMYEDTECPFCSLMEKAERRYIDFYLGSSVMNPETRVKVNTVGFCPAHYSALAKEPKPQGLALISHTHLLETQRALQPLQDSLKSIKKGKKAKKITDQIREVLKQRESGCLICESMEMTLLRYAYTYVFLWGSEPEFKEAVEKSKGICLHHYPVVLDITTQALEGKQQQEFLRSISTSMDRWLSQTAEDVHWMTQMYKSENRDKDWRGTQDAHRRAINRENGCVRFIKKES